MKGKQIIDIHCHVHQVAWNLSGTKIDYRDPIIRHCGVNHDGIDILSNMNIAGISHSVIFPIPASGHVNINKANESVISLAKNNPNLIPFTIIDNSPKYWIGAGARGFKEHNFLQRTYRGEDGKPCFYQGFKESYEILEKYGLPLILHAGENRVDRIKKDIMKDTPNLLIILAHLGADFPENNNFKPRLGQVKETLTALREYQTIYFDFSAIEDMEILKMAIDIVGPKRLIWGSDAPFIENPFDFGKYYKELGLSTEDMEDIFFRNAVKILGLGA